ncbi:MAG: hypothetical protein GF418_01455 [Chitinivibrionales bacterium]|nr:hypothetical protein [Chitinivibrionales bacterium]MBD3394269.1 hypothetical protein [Chitinivibrionales bacterium]
MNNGFGRSVWPGLLAAGCIACVTAVSAGAPRGGLEFYGSMYGDLSLYHFDVNDNDSLAFGGRNTLTLNMKNINRKHGKIESGLDIIMLYGIQADAMHELVPDALYTMLPAAGAPILLDLRKLYFSVYLPFVDLSVGRQIINFGKGYVFSPVDVFSSVDVLDITLRRRGSDVACARFPLGTLAGVDVVGEFPVGANDHASAVKAFANVLGFDWSILGMYRHDSREITGGAAFKGDLEAGIYGEAAQHFLDGSGDRYFEGMLGADYSFLKNDLIVQAEYLHSGRPDSVLSIWGKHNAFTSALYRINDIMNVSASLIHNFTDDMSIGTAQYYYNVLQNVDAIVYVRGYRGNLNGFAAFPDLEYSLRLEVKF